VNGSTTASRTRGALRLATALGLFLVTVVTALAVSGAEAGATSPSAPTQVCARGANGHLLEYVPDHQNGNVWNVTDLTAVAGGGAPVTGNPTQVFAFAQDLVHIYVPGPSGHLMEYIADNAGGHTFNAYDLTAAAGGGMPITGSPSALIDEHGLVHVYVPGPGGHLFEYVPDHQNGNIWNAYDVTAAAGGGVPVGDPSALVDYLQNGLVRVYVPGPGGHLTEYLPDHQNGNIWNAYDVTAAAGGGVPTTGNPAATLDPHGVVRVYVAGPGGHLDEYVPDHQNGNIWNAYNLTAAAGGGAPITGSPSVVDANQGLVNVYVPGPGGHLVEYVPDHQNGNIWNAYDLTAVAGGGAPVTGGPSPMYVFFQNVIHVYVPGPGGHLVEYIPDHQNGNIWNAYDVTAVAGGGAPVTGTPSALSTQILI
jgi:catechol 2,3-dioxygenase-like lactoylglutathione lyase family enzyme